MKQCFNFFSRFSIDNKHMNIKFTSQVLSFYIFALFGIPIFFSFLNWSAASLIRDIWTLFSYLIPDHVIQNHVFQDFTRFTVELLLWIFLMW